MKIIISGVPCCGKTHFGDWLRDQRGFAHANLEPRAHPNAIIPPTMSPTLPHWLALLATDVVVTWGFPPHPQCIGLILRFRDLGFTPWWFAGEYDIARERYLALKREQATEQWFDPQIERLKNAKAQLDAIYQNHSIETLTHVGNKPVEEINDIITADVA